MGRPIEIAIDAKTKDAETGIERVANSLDKAGDALDDLGSTSRKAGGVVETSLKDAGKQADRLDRDLTAALDDAAKSAKRTGEAIGDNIRRGARDADEGVSALKENTASNAKEMGASFQDATSAIDSMQGLASEALEGFGPAGIAAGVGLAAGIGIAQQALQKSADYVNNLKEQASGLAQAWRDATTPEQMANLQQQWDDLSAKIIDNKSWFEPWQHEAITAIDAIAAAVQVDRPRVKAFMDAFTETDPIKRQQELADALADARTAAGALGTQIDGLTSKQKLAAHAGRDGVVATESWTDADEAALAAAQAHKTALDGVIPVMQQEADQATATAREIEAMAEAQGLTVDAYKAKAAAAQKAAEDQAAGAQKVAQAAEAERSALQTADDAYRSSVASLADLGTLLGDAWNDPQSPLRKWADAQAKATKKADDTWADFQDKATPAKALEAVMDQMSKEIAANDAFESNLAALAERGFGALAADLRQGGPKANGAITQALAEGTDATVQTFAIDRGKLTGRSLIAGAAAAFANDPTLQKAVDGVVSGITPPNIVVTLLPDDTAVRRWAANPVVVNAVARVGRPQAT